jgi:hypothetical protein
MASTTVVATANVLSKLGTADAEQALDGVLSAAPDIVGLQEWVTSRTGLLRARGELRRLPGLSFRREAMDRYLWYAGRLGRCVVGVRADRYQPLRARLHLLSGFEHTGSHGRPLGIEPPRCAVSATFDDRLTGLKVGVVVYHLSPGTQSKGCYRDDRPRLAARHRREVERLQRIVDGLLDTGHVVYALGDSNFHGLQLRGLTSAWVGREDEPGTLSSYRKIDDVFGPGVPMALARLASASDHQAVVVTRADPVDGSRPAP